MTEMRKKLKQLLSAGARALTAIVQGVLVGLIHSWILSLL